MASITGKRIREVRHKSITGSPLIFQPNTDLATALDRHNEAYDWLSLEQRQTLSPKFWRDLVDTLVPTKKAERKRVFREFLSNFSDPKYFSSTKKKEIQTAEEKARGQKEINDFFEENTTHGVFFAYAEHYARTKIFDKFPPTKLKFEDSRFGGPNPYVTEISFYLFGGEWKGDKRDTSLFLDDQSKQPKPFYRDYLESLSRENQHIVKRLVRNLQDLSRYSKIWSAYLLSRGLTIKTADDTDIELYPAWRKTNRLPGHLTRNESGLPKVGYSSIKKEVLFFKGACRYAQAKRMITYNPAVNLSIKVDRTLSEKEKPLDLQTFGRLLEFLKSTLKNDPSDKTQLNVKSIYFLILTGCRPSEIKNFQIYGEKIRFNPNRTGKTKQAVRALPLTPKLREIAEDSILDQNQDCRDVSTRIYQWLQRNDWKINPYRFRHTWATIQLVLAEISLQEIAYRLGHSDSGFTQRVYGHMDIHLRQGNPEVLKRFWKGLNGITGDVGKDGEWEVYVQ